MTGLGLRFQSVVQRHAADVALWFDDRNTVTYADLNARANQIAGWLIDRGIAPGAILCLSGGKSLSTFACMIAALKTGAAYCILDGDSPAERVRKILSTCRPALLLADAEFLDRFGQVAADLGIAVQDNSSGAFWPLIDRYPGADLAPTGLVSGETPAYVMFTSGSTGFPKGAVITHANLLSFVDWIQRTLDIAPHDRLTNLNALYFDNSVFDVYAALFSGARLVPFSREDVVDPGRLIARTEAAGCTVWFSVPSLLIFLQTMRALDGTRLKSIRSFVFGGEGYPKAKLKDLYAAYSPASAFYNVYGPTECTCMCSSHRIGAADLEDLQGFPTLGHIADTFEFLILDDAGRRVAPGETGELCLSGPGVGQGYCNDPERTAASFVPNPYSSTGAIMYRTGDLVSVSPSDGLLYIHGRKDNQIKHMGYRIELEEIETALSRLDYVSEAVVLHAAANGRSPIVAVIACRGGHDDERIRQDLRAIIPAYMIPSVFHRQEALPKNANGKLDRRRLAETYLR